MSTQDRARIVGRIARLLLGAALLVSAIPPRGTPLSPLLLSLVAAVGLLVFYLLVHWAVVRLAPGLPKWLGAIVANGPAGAVFFLGLPGGLIFGKGEGAEAVLLYVGVSLVVMALRAEAGCEVMTLPNMIFGRSTQLPCLLFSPIDALERRMGRKNSAFPG